MVSARVMRRPLTADWSRWSQFSGLVSLSRDAASESVRLTREGDETSWPELMAN